MSDVTVVLTSFNRADLLEKTLDSFFEMNTYPLERFIIMEDSEIEGCVDFVHDRYDMPIEVYYNKPRLHQVPSVDKGYSMVETPYIFHMEEDWEFVKPGFIEASKPVLEADPNIIDVWLRGLDDDTLPHPYFPDRYEVNGNLLVQVQPTGLWNGFTFNPGLKRRKDWEELPNGYNGCTHVTPEHLSGGYTLECDISVEYHKRGRIAMRLVESYVRHSGWGRHVN